MRVQSPSRSPAQLVVLFERVFTVGAFILFMDAFARFVRGGWSPDIVGAETAPGGWQRQAVWVLVYTTTLVLLTFRPRAALRTLARDKFLVGFLLLASMSVLWSIDPTDTFLRVTSLFGATLFGIYVVTRYPIDEVISMLGIAFGIVVVSSYLFVIGLPEYGVHFDKHYGDWRGVFTTKNRMGNALVLGGGTLALLALRSRTMRFPRVTGMLLAFGLIVMSRSMTALVAAFMLAIGIPIAVASVRRHFLLVVPTMIVFVVGLAAFAGWTIQNLGEVTGAIGRSETFTGRGTLWVVLIPFVRDRFWMGHGFGTFWSATGGRIAEVWEIFPGDWLPPHAHNAALDLALSVGMIGVALFVTHFLMTLKHALRETRRGPPLSGPWCLFVLGFIVVTGITESILWHSNSIVWVAYVVVCLHVRGNNGSRAGLLRPAALHGSTAAISVEYSREMTE